MIVLSETTVVLGCIIVGMLLLCLGCILHDWAYARGYTAHKKVVSDAKELQSQAVKDRAKAQVDAWIEEQMRKDGVI